MEGLGILGRLGLEGLLLFMYPNYIFYKVGNAIAHYANIALDKGIHVFKINRLEEKTKTNYNIKHIFS